MMFSILGYQVKFSKPACFVGLRKGEWHTPPASVYWRNPRRTEGGTADQAGSWEVESPGPEGSRPVYPSSRYSWWVLSLLLRGCSSWGAGAVTKPSDTFDERLQSFEKSFLFGILSHMQHEEIVRFVSVFLITKSFKETVAWTPFTRHCGASNYFFILLFSPQINGYREYSSFACK